MHLFEPNGIHVVVDGQFGSTGKGALSAWLADEAIKDNAEFKGVISNAGPNSGHTFYFGDTKYVLKQLPSFAVYQALAGNKLDIILTAGSIIDPEILAREAEQYPGEIFVNPNAAVITPEDKHAEHSGTIAAVAGTRSGTGAALARKVQRDPEAVFRHAFHMYDWPGNIRVDNPLIRWRSKRYFMEVSQGFSLGINQRFYPKCTSRECTVSQAISDASLPPRSVKRTYMSMRTYPIRVGNVDGHSSGEWYDDQVEITWEEINQPPELTTVTQRERRIATFSTQQMIDAVTANDPDFVFMNFANYLPDRSREEFLRFVHRFAQTDKDVKLLVGNGPKVKDVERWRI